MTRWSGGSLEARRHQRPPLHRIIIIVIIMIMIMIMIMTMIT